MVLSAVASSPASPQKEEHERENSCVCYVYVRMYAHTHAPIYLSIYLLYHNSLSSICHLSPGTYLPSLGTHILKVLPPLLPALCVEDQIFNTRLLGNIAIWIVAEQT